MPAPIGNKYAEGCETSGRPPLFKNVKVLQKKIEEYFNQDNVKFTITGLCLFCGFESRQSFYAYEKKKEFTYIIKRARLAIENMYEQQLFSNIHGGAIFALKNMGWEDKHDITSGGKQIIPVIKFSNNDK